MSARQRAWVFRAAALGLGLVLCEAALSLVSLVSPRVRYFLSPPWARVTIPDPVLGQRMSPFYPGNDAWGFRNRRVPERCEMLAVGDSLTYGYAASAEKSWPRQLEALSGRSTYNMSCGGYGPCEYDALVRQGLGLKPRGVLLGLYVGNDVADAYRTVYMDGRFSAFRARDEATLSAMRKADEVATLRELAQADAPSWGDAPKSRMREWLAEKSSLYAVCRELRQLVAGKRYGSFLREDEPPQDAFEVAARRPGRVAFGGERRFRTVFMAPEYFGLAVDVSDPRIREGKRIVESAIQSMQSRLGDQGVRLAVVLLPTKPRVYRDLVRARGADTPAKFFEAVEMEERLTTEMEAFLRRRQIEYVNTAAALSRCFERGVRAYPESDDEHPNANGYRAISEAVLPMVMKLADGEAGLRVTAGPGGEPVP